MLRMIGAFGVGIVFVAISPGLRRTIMDGYEMAQKGMIENSPWSFAAAGAVLLVAAMYWLRHANQPKDY